MKRITLLGALAVAMLALNALPARGQGNTINGCYSNSNGSLRRITPPEVCKPGESPISWNIIGPQGPKGDKGDRGAAGPTEYFFSGGVDLTNWEVPDAVLVAPFGPGE
jgi:hypothetical protein